MQATFTRALALTLSTERLDAYRDRMIQETPDRQLFGRYVWNMALSESLYPTLQMLEVALRNTLHQALTAHAGRAEWFDVAGLLKHAHERDAIQKAKTTLALQGKPQDAGRIVAELTFGFWTSLLDRRYEQTLWPQLLKVTLPYMPRKHRTRLVVCKRLNRMRQLRNRIFHHEPIWHWKDLAQQHTELLEAIAWITPAAKDLVQIIDRFPSIHVQGPARIEQALTAFC